MPARMAIVTNPLTNMKAAQTGRSGKRPRRPSRRRRSTRPRVTAGSSSTEGPRRPTGSGSAIRTAGSHAAVEVERVHEDGAVDEKQDEGRGSGRRQHRRMPSQQRVEGRGQKPELDHHENAYQQADGGEERDPLPRRVHGSDLPPLRVDIVVQDLKPDPGKPS